MVERQLRRRGIADERVLEAMGKVPRQEFVPASVRSRAYDDCALAIAAGQTISQPWIVAAICQALELKGSDRVLEVGTGSGYSASILARLCAEVITVERHEGLARGAEVVLREVGAGAVEVVVGDGSLGIADRAPFDAIAVHAALPTLPETLLTQLGEGGRLVAPVATATGDGEALTVFRRREDRIHSEVISPCAFVPLIGEEGYAETP